MTSYGTLIIEDVGMPTPHSALHANSLEDFDAEDTQRFSIWDFNEEVPTDPDATSIYDLNPPSPRFSLQRVSEARRRQIQTMRQDIAGLREAVESGWDVAFELAHEEQRLAALEEAVFGFSV